MHDCLRGITRNTAYWNKILKGPKKLNRTQNKV